MGLKKCLEANTPKSDSIFSMALTFLFIFSSNLQKNYDEADEDCKHGEEHFKIAMIAPYVPRSWKYQVVTSSSDTVAEEVLHLVDFLCRI